ncbi:uncharacterized protein FPRO_06215 [Fusarium proliferatum ET1]|uniref:Uncharacterized protein n=1 Tax=Fusarium proliferatum (strain ET1) TaxID=1227346 RepID=A0A1L7VE32_FUSPR|nr:uncharacterized protein FPRO_06215 [Fusarium proliferatum ET1]CVL10758.1 uncharacterized protein FPRN_06058 [Fusarium proliferatum]CZR38594.1 uncharacterized protein FPRO_06215 [Fusarium proliferatum ET1]
MASDASWGIMMIWSFIVNLTSENSYAPGYSHAPADLSSFFTCKPSCGLSLHSAPFPRLSRDAQILKPQTRQVTPDGGVGSGRMISGLDPQIQDQSRSHQEEALAVNGKILGGSATTKAKR